MPPGTKVDQAIPCTGVIPLIRASGGAPSESAYAVNRRPKGAKKRRYCSAVVLFQIPIWSEWLDRSRLMNSFMGIGAVIRFA